VPFLSRSDGTPADGAVLGRWAINIPFLRVQYPYVQIQANQPSWHWVIHFIGYAGVARMVLATFGMVSTENSVLAYGLCILLAMITGQVVKIFKSERTPRIFSAIIGLTGFTFACIGNLPGIHHKPDSVMAALVIPLSAAGFVLLINMMGEALATWFPAPTPGGDRPGRARRGQGWLIWESKPNAA
jgi:hypothetical protein